MKRRSLVRWIALSIFAFIVFAGTVLILSVFNSPVSGSIPHWVRVENASMECVNTNNSPVLRVTGIVNYSCSYKVDGRNELPLKIVIEIETYSNESHYSEIVAHREILVNLPFHETYNFEENFSVPNGRYKGKISVFALKKGRWWGEWWVLTGYRRVVLGPVTVE